MDKNSYKPGFEKLIHHWEHLDKIRNAEVTAPIHVSFFPTNFCNLNCEYCCFKNTVRTEEELSFEDFKIAIDTLVKYGTRAIEISGGGEPLMWHNFDEAINYAYSKQLKISLITNGILLPTKSEDVLKKFNWIRVSIQSLEYAKNIQMNHIPNSVKKSMSYIVYDSRTFEGIKKIYQFAKDSDIVVRVAPIRPCNFKLEKAVGDEVNRLGYPLVFFEKESGVPLSCYMAYIRGAINWKGEFLPCPSIEITNDSVGKIPEDFALCKVSELESWFKENRPSDLGYRCKGCTCAVASNNFIHNMMSYVEDVDFV